MGGTDGGSRWMGGARERRRPPTGVLEGVDLHVQQREGLSEAVGHRRLLLLEDLGHLRRSGEENHLHVTIIIIIIIIDLCSLSMQHHMIPIDSDFPMMLSLSVLLLLKPTKSRILI